MAVGDPVTFLHRVSTAQRITFQPAPGVRILVTATSFYTTLSGAVTETNITDDVKSVRIGYSNSTLYTHGVSGTGAITGDATNRVGLAVRHVIITNDHFLEFVANQPAGLGVYACGWEI